jgi:hypothetical protein
MVTLIAFVVVSFKDANEALEAILPLLAADALIVIAGCFLTAN